MRCWQLLAVMSEAKPGSILMVTMGGTKSHTVPFAALSRALVARGHNITLLSAFPGKAIKCLADFIITSLKCKIVFFHCTRKKRVKFIIDFYLI
jgi:hypothetical protein